MKFGLSQSQFNLIEILAIQPLKQLGARVWIFGSRARGDFKEFSDIDLMYEFNDKKPLLDEIFSIRTNLEDSNLIIKVDLVNRKQLAESYRMQVEDEKIEV